MATVVGDDLLKSADFGLGISSDCGVCVKDCG